MGPNGCLSYDFGACQDCVNTSSGKDKGTISSQAMHSPQAAIKDLAVYSRTQRRTAENDSRTEKREVGQCRGERKSGLPKLQKKEKRNSHLIMFLRSFIAEMNKPLCQGLHTFVTY